LESTLTFNKPGVFTMKIAVIAPTEIPARRANTVQVMKMTQALVSLGHETRLASPYTRPILTPGDVIEPAAQGHQWEYLAPHYGLQHQFPVAWLEVRSRLRRYDYGLAAVRWARSWGADIVFTRLPQAAALSSSLGMGTILEAHDLPHGKMGGRLFRRFLRGSGARRLVVITHALREDLAGIFDIPKMSPYEQRFTVVAPDGVDLDRYSSLPSPIEARKWLTKSWHDKDRHVGRSLQVDRFTIGYTGHLYAGRGTHMLLSLAERLPDMTFIVVGGEPAQVELLRDQSKRRGLNNVFLTGFVPNAELPGYQSACDVLLMPYQGHVAASSGGDISRYLSPMKLFEYMASERAILSSDLPVLSEILNPDNAVLLHPEDVDAWEDALKHLEINPDYRRKLAAQARKDVQHYTWVARAERILDGIA
jgi:glycosyltransferase involved in cell wall biosynthesis